MPTCPNGHRNPEHQRYCGECGAALGQSGEKDETAQARPSEPHRPDDLEAPPPVSQRQDDPFDIQNPGGDDGAGGRLEVGDEVQVVNHSGTLDGMVGVIDEITDEDHLLVVMEHLWGRHAFRQDQLQVLKAGPQTAISNGPTPKNAAVDRTGWRVADIPRESPQAPKPTGVLSNRAQLSSNKRVVGFIALGLLGLVAIGVWVVSRAVSLTPAEKHYLAAIHDPCAHSEIYDEPANYQECRSQDGDAYWVWNGSDRDQVKEGHQICSIEASVPIYDRYQAAKQMMVSRHPYYTVPYQINTEIIAAEQILCK
jgi:hypothetical protein